MPGVIERYRKRLPVTDATPVISLNEGDTPLIPSVRLAPELGVDLYFKFEGLNPTGSFKDRGMTVAVSKAVEAGEKVVVCASTGNTSASAAAYAARAGIQALVVIPEGKVALGKLSQSIVHGAVVVQIEGNFDAALRVVRELAQRHHACLVNSINPYRIEGQKTAAFEIVDALRRAPDLHFLPVGNAGNITAYWKGYREYHADGLCALPKMMGFQAEGAAPIVRGQPVEKPETVATAIRIGNPASWKQAEAARDESGGVIDMVSDQEILAAYALLASKEGIFCEPASAASVAGLLKYARAGRLAQFAPRGRKPLLVCTLTGHGLKDPDQAIAACPRPLKRRADADLIAKEIGL